MQYLESDLGYRTTGEVVQFTLSGNAAHVRLLDSLNFNNYKNGQPYRFYGGLASARQFTFRSLARATGTLW